MQYSAQDMFQVQSELVETKVEMAVSKSVDKIIGEIHALRTEMNARFTEVDKRMDARFEEVYKHMDERFAKVDERFAKVDERFAKVDERLAGLDNRLISVETQLGLVAKRKEAIFSHLLDYAFKGAWIVLSVVVAVILMRH